jgi:hypothetical protein
MPQRKDGEDGSSSKPKTLAFLLITLAHPASTTSQKSRITLDIQITVVVAMADKPREWASVDHQS